MNGDLGRWNDGLLVAGLVVVLGMIGFVSAQVVTDRSLSRGLLLQGTLLAGVVAAAFHEHRGELKLIGLLIIGLLIVQSIWPTESHGDQKPPDEVESP